MRTGKSESHTERGFTEMARLTYKFAVAETRYPVGRQPVVVCAQDGDGIEYAGVSRAKADQIALMLRSTRMASDGEYAHPTYSVYIL